MVEIREFIFTYTPWDNSFPIYKCVLTIIAKDRKAAELIALTSGWRFFEQDHNVVVTEGLVGYKR